MTGWAITDDKPVLAICRGAQMLNVVCGGTLYQDVATEMPAVRNHEISRQQEDGSYVDHRLIIAPNSLLAAK